MAMIAANPARAFGATTSRARVKRATRARTTPRANLVDDFFDAVLPKPLTQARKSMEFFDGPGGMLAKVIPWNAKPTVEAPRVDVDGVVFDFSRMRGDEFAAKFSSLNDVVMGGRSDADVVLENGRAVMRGVTEDQFGGFASFKCRDFDRALDLSAYDGLSLTCAGDGLRYKVIAYDSDDSFNVAFHQTFECPIEMREVKVRFGDFVPVKRGRAVAKSDPEYRTFDGKRIVSLQFMLSKFDYGMENLNTNYKPGAFEFQLARVEAYKD